MEDEIDLQLKQLAVEAQNHPVRSRQRNRALNSLIRGIGHCPRLARPYKDSWPSHIYEDIYNEALGRTFEYICQNIDTYDSQRPVMAWMNYFLNFRFQDVCDRYTNQIRPRMNQTRIKILSIDDLEGFNLEQEEWELYQDKASMSQLVEDAEMLRKLIEEDPDNVFRNKTVRGRPDITWQVIALARLDDETLDSISQRFGVSISTIQTFFDRNLRNFSDIIRNNLQ
jgi:DNA-directed RNA polymerase specialized sigma24 family protein